MKSKEEEMETKKARFVYFSTTDEVGLPVVWAGDWHERIAEGMRV